MRRIECLVAGAAVLLASLVAAAPAGAQISIAQTFYVPVPGVQVRTWANAIQTLTANDTIRSVISITATAPDTVLYYDHWEDGYEIDITLPIQSTTEIWGDRDCSNGFTPTLASCTPGTDDANDVVNAADILIKEDDVPVPGGVRDATEIRFDGADKFAVTEFVAVTRAAWPSTGPEAQLGGAVEVFDTQRWGTSYEAPVGENNSPPPAFEYVGLAIMAEEDGTVVGVDLNADGTDDQTYTLNQGQSVLVGQVGVTDVFTGASVTASADVQVDLLTANEGTNYEGRWYSLVPTADWDSRYYSPVGSTVTGDLVHVYLYNPGAGSISVAARQQSGCQNLTVNGGAVLEVAIPVTSPISAAAFSTEQTCAGAAGSSAPFFAIATIDRNETIHDWGFTLIPTSSLTPTAVVGWAPGSTDLSENASPVWVTAVDPPDPDGPGGQPPQTTLYVDFDGNPATGSLTDPFGNSYDLACTVTALESVRIFDGGGTGSCTRSPGDNDQTGMRVYTADGTRITAAWGQDPEFSSSGQPQQLDMGTTVLPFSSLTAFKSGALLGDANGNGGLDAGETILYTIRVKNTGIISITNVDLLDTLDPNTSYVAGTTRVDGVLIADDSSGTPFPLDGSPVATGYQLVASPDELAPREERVVTFVVQLANPLPGAITEIVNQVTVTSDTETFVDADSQPLQQAALTVTKASSAAGGEVGPGEAITYTVTVTNSSPATVTGIRVADPAPAGTSYVAGSTVATGPQQIYVADRFEAVAYSNNDGPTSWAGNWIETDNGGAGAAAGDVQVVVTGTNGELRIEDDTSVAARAVDLSGLALPGAFAMLSFDHRLASGVDTGDFVLVQGSTTGTGGPWATVPGGTIGGISGSANPMPSGRLAFDLSGFIAAGSAVRFDIPTNDYNGTNEFFYVDDLELRVVGAGDSATDNFASGGYGGGSGGPPGTGWTGPWVEVDSAGGGEGAGEIQIAGQTARLGGDKPAAAPPNSLARTVDLSGAVLALLRFDWGTSSGITQGLEDDDLLEVQVSTDGIGFTTLGSFVNDPSGTRGYDLTPYISATTTIRFSVEQNTTGSEFFTIDNVAVLAGRHVSVAKDNSGGGTPQLVEGVAPNLVNPADHFALAAGESMAVTFSVTVDDPVNLPRIVNTVTTTAFENAEPTHATVIDPVVVGGAIGDLVWLDVDRDGVYDVGEPGLGGVRVWMDTNGDGAFTAGVDRQQTTDANGRYLFGNTVPGSYAVYVDDSTLPAALDIAPGSVDPVSGIVITGADERVLDVDFGYTTQPASAVVGDRVWSDADGDGIQDPGEVGLGGVTVTLRGAGPDGVFGTGDDTTATTTTDADGSYLFAGVPPGKYRAEVSGVPAGYTATSGPQSEGGTISAPFTLLGGDVIADVDFGFQNPALFSITDTVWFDSDGNGLLGPGEDGLAGVSVNLLDAGGNLLATTISGADGTFTFSGLPNGDYTIEIGDTGGKLEGLFGTTTAAQARSRAVTVAGANLSGENFGYSAAGWIGDRVWSDADGDGVQDPGESGLGGVTLSLVDVTTGSVVATTTTAADGSYLFKNTAPGAYTVRVTGGLPAGAVQTGDPTVPGVDCRPSNCDALNTAAVGFLTSDLQQDFGYLAAGLAAVRGTVFDDPDRDGVLDGGEPGIPAVTLELVAAGSDGIFGTNDDLVVATTTSAADGSYVFPDVPDGTYQVRVTDAAGVLEGYDLTSGLDAITVSVAAGPDLTGVDFGYTRSAATGAIGDTVFFDADRDGVRDPGEPGISGVTISLIDVGIDGIQGTADDGPTRNTTSDASGRYAFAALPAGNYVVDVTDTGGRLAGLALTAGSDPTAVIPLSEGEVVFDADFGYASAPATGSAIGDLVWYDTDGDGIRDPDEVGIGGVQITVVGPSGTFTTTTGADGSWLVTGLAAGTYTVTVNTATLPAGYSPVPTNGAASRQYTVTATQDLLLADFGFNGGNPGSMSGTVYFDGDGDGTQDVPGEVGLEFVTVNLVDPVAGTILATTTTNANGDYSFSGLQPGSYNVVVSDLDGIVAELNGTEAPSLPVAVAAGATVSNLDFGFAPTAVGSGTIGDLVFHDINANGVFDPLGADGIAGTADDESGFEGVTVELWVDVNGNGVIEPGTDNLVRSTITDSNGNYEFLGVPYDRYLVTVTDRNRVLDIDGNGVVDEWILTTGVDPTAVTLDATTPSNFDADFGYRAVGGRLVSGTVFFDFAGNGFLDPSDAGVAGATLSLYRDLDGDGVLDPGEPLIGTTVSSDGTLDVDGNGSVDPPGFYAFGDLVPGDYVVTVDPSATFVAGFDQTTQAPANPVERVTVVAGACTDCAGNDFGFTIATTRVLVSGLWTEERGGGVAVFFETVAEDGAAGFYLYRWDGADEEWEQVNDELLPAAVGAPQGAIYGLEDLDAIPGLPGRYALVEVEAGGAERTYGPFTAGASGPSRRAAVGPRRQERSRRAVASPHRTPTAAASVGVELLAGGGFEELSRAIRRRLDRVKITTGDEGLYFVAAADLAAKLDVPHGRIRGAISAGKLSLSSRGRPVAWLDAGRGAGIFFVAEALESPFARENVYWLEAGPGTSMATLDGDAPSAGSTTTFAASLVAEEDLFAVTVLPTADEDFYYWAYVSSGHPTYGTAAVTMRVDDPVATGGTYRLTVGLQGMTSTPARDEHRAVIAINGVEAGEIVWDGSTRTDATLELPDDMIFGGDNTVEVRGELGAGIPYSVFLLDSLTLEYRRLHRAVDDALRFSSGGAPVVTVEGFTSPEVMVFDITRPAEPRLVTGVAITAGSESGVSFRPEGAEHRYLAVSAAGVKVPLAVEARPRAKLRELAGAEYVVIAPPELAAGAAELAAYRQASGLSTLVVGLDDVYDDFGFGLETPGAIADFVAFAYREWSQPPRFVTLAGKATFDYLDVQGQGDNLLPTMLRPTPYGLYASDLAYGDVEHGDGVPEVAIGRIPALTNGELVAYLEKLAVFEGMTAGTGPQSVLLTADGDDRAGDFTATSRALEAMVPQASASDEVYLAEIPAAEARARLLAALGAGVDLVNYVGHGGPDRLADEGLVTVADVGGLVGPRLPVVTTLTCSVGRFELPGWTSLGEALVLEPMAGAAAVFAPSGQSIHAEAALLNEALFRAIFEGEAETIGEAVQAALAEFSQGVSLAYMLEIYNTLGDPAFRLR